MKKRYGGLVVFVVYVMLIFSVVAAYAEEQYQAEITANYDRIDTDQNSRTIVYGVSAEVFFAPVQTAEHPYAEAAFLERIGSVNVTVWDEKVKAGTLEGHGPMLSAGINYAKPDFPLAIQAMYSTTKVDFDAPGNSTMKSNAYYLGIGNYFTHTLLAGIEYTNSKTDFSQPSHPTDSSKDTSYGLFAKYVYDLANEKGLNFEGRLLSRTADDGTDNLKNTIEQFSVDYFFNRGLSAGIGINNNSGQDLNNEGRTYSANVHYFISPRFSVKTTYDRFLNANAGDMNYKSFGVTVAARF